jgi:hypothetical protein
MIRFIKNILDINNLLGMQRVVPPTPPTPILNPQIEMRSVGGTCIFMPTFTSGELIVQYTSGGVLIEEHYDTSYSGTAISVNVDGSYLIKIKNTDSNLTINAIEAIQNINSVEIIDHVESVQIPQAVTTLNIQNASELETVIPTESQFGVIALYGRATNTDERDASKEVIDYNVNPGSICTLLIDSGETYAADVITTAITAGWNVIS